MIRDIHISLVSHDHAEWVARLLSDLAKASWVDRIQLTLTQNIPEQPLIDYHALPFPINHVINSSPKGFAANHNQAFHCAPQPEAVRFFLVLNPDIRLQDEGLTQLIEHLSRDEHCGVISALVVNAAGLREDNARLLPTPLGLLGKILYGYSGKWPLGEQTLYQPDWIAGMFMLFRAEIYAQLGGFDARYYMYYEDVDICSRLWLQGYTVALDTRMKVIHEAQRASHRSWRYFFWHLSSMARFFCSPIFMKAWRFHRSRLINNQKSRRFF